MSDDKSQESSGTTTARIEELLPAVRRGERAALDQIMTIAHARLEQLVRTMMGGFSGGVSRGFCRGDEQTGIIVNNLYHRLRTAVENQKLSNLTFPGGFWKIAADNVRYILLEQARERSRARKRQFGDGGDDDSPGGDRGGSGCGARTPPRGGGPRPVGTDDSESRDGASPPPADPLHEIPDHRQASPESTLDAFSIRREILEAIGKLDEPYQTVISLYYYDGLTQKQISDILRDDDPTMYERKVGRLIKQAEDKLRKMLKNLNDDDDGSDYENDA